MDTLYKGLICFLGTVLLFLPGQAQEKVSRELSKTYPFTSNGTVHLENKYGNINVYAWEKEEVLLTIEISVTHKKRDNAQDLLKRIKPVLQHSENYLSVAYEIGDKSSNFFSQLFEKANPFDFDRGNVQIDFSLQVPTSAELEIKNKFGDVIIEDWTGALDAELEHGNIWIGENLKNATVSIKFGKLRAQNITHGKFEVKNGGLDMKDAKNLRLNSSGSELQLGAVDVLELESNKDVLLLQEVGDLYGTSKFSRTELNRLQKDLDMSLKISDLTVGEIIGNDVNIAIIQESSDITMNISGFSHQFRAVLEEGLVRLPKSYREVDSKLLDKGKKLREIHAAFGKDRRGTITVEGKKGVLLLKEF